MDPFAIQRIAVGVIAWSCAMRLQQAVALMDRGQSFTQAFAVETFGPLLLVLALLWWRGLLVRPGANPLAGVASTVALSLIGVMATRPLLQAILVQLPEWLVERAGLV